MAALPSAFSRRNELHTGVFSISGNIPSSATSLVSALDSGETNVFEVGFDQREELETGLRSNLSRQKLIEEDAIAVAISDFGMDLANTLNAGNNLTSTERAFSPNKIALYDSLSNANILVPRYRTAANREELLNVLESQNFEQGLYILKPSIGSNSEGVYRSSPTESIEDTVNTFWSLGLTVPLDSTDQQSIVMDYIESNNNSGEVAVDAFVLDGKVVFNAVHEKLVVNENPFSDTLMVCPPVSNNVSELEESISELTQRVVTATARANGCIHIEMRLSTNGELYVIDASPRFGGGFISHSIVEVYGVDLRLLHFLVETNQLANIETLSTITQKFEEHPQASCSTCIGLLFASPNSTINMETLIDIQKQLDSPAVFASNVRCSLIDDPLWKSDLAISVGFKERSSASAAELLNTFAEKYELR